MERYCEIDELKGVVLDGIEGALIGSDEIIFISGKKKWKMYHDQDCCESVELNDIIGDLKDIVGSKILKAYESSNENPNTPPLNENEDSYTWTFYRISTIKGTVTFRWYGTSNGYYSESVYFTQIAP
jgi:hypothetical protein